MTDAEIDLIANGGHRNVIGGIYATSVHDFARAIIAQARAELIAELVPVAVRAQGGTLYPTACQDAAIIRSRGSEALAIIPKD